MQKGFIIAIDGPVASGKGTLAPILARKLHGFYLYTGAMYRGLAYFCKEKNIAVTDKPAVLAILSEFTLELIDQQVIVQGVDVTEKIKAEDIGMAASTVASIPGVGDQMILLQQQIGVKKVQEGLVVVAEGRNVGNSIFPSATCKIFLTASPEIRAQRRLAQIQQRGDKSTFKKVLEDIQKRDEQDINRKTYPLSKDPVKDGYFVLDDSSLTEEETLNVIMSELQRRKLVK